MISAEAFAKLVFGVVIFVLGQYSLAGVFRPALRMNWRESAVPASGKTHLGYALVGLGGGAMLLTVSPPGPAPTPIAAMLLIGLVLAFIGNLTDA